MLVVLFFSMAGGKREVYVMPVIGGRIAEIGGAIILIVVAGSFLVTWQA